MIVAKDLRLAYQDGSTTVAAVDGVSLEVKPGEFVGLLGPSGSGKSSLLYLLAGLKRPTGGDVLFKSTSLPGLAPDELALLRRERFGFVFQNHFLVNYLTGEENVLTGGNPGHAEASGAKAGASKLLEELGVGHCRDKFPWQMSAGERQRVAIARAVIHAPEVVFADEPTASLDRPNAELVKTCLRRATASGTLFVVTHDESIVQGATRVLRMRAGKADER